MHSSGGQQRTGQQVGEWRLRTSEGDIDVRWTMRDRGADPLPFGRGDLVDLRHPRPQPRVRRPDSGGRVTALRAPVSVPPEPGRIAIRAIVPDPPKDPAAMAWSAIVPSVVSGAVGAVVFSPLFALLAVASVAVCLGRWMVGRISHARVVRHRRRAIIEADHEFEAAVAAWARAEIDRRCRLWPSPAGVLRSASSLRTPWNHRLGADDELTVAVGDGSCWVQPTLSTGESSERTSELAGVPILVGLAPGRGLAVVGDRSSVLDSARWLISSSAARYGPADLDLLVLTTPDRLSDWDWIKWLPSLVSVVCSDEETEQMLHLIAEASRPALVVVDGREPGAPGPLAVALSGRLERSRILWLGDSPSVPAACTHELRVAPDAGFELVDLVTPASVPTIHGDVFAFETAAADLIARSLAPFVDPERDEPAARLPRSASFADLVELDLADPAASTAQVALNWDTATRRRIVVPVGLADHGLVEIDLVGDGPHGLVAGTTGSGKSELLRTMIAGIATRQPPDLVSFVLIDFKGGGAFDVVAGLPHVSAVVTDLDRHGASRALRSLRAELADRERRLRTIGESDLSDVPLGHGLGFPRLVVVVDEFAALADELPDFLDGLVDIARRGRSLGVHLILATQRPAGVVTGQIRANTNLRICLRVQDRADSFDVIDVGDAADLPAIAGRAIVRLGSDRNRFVQVAHLGAVSGPLVLEPFVVHPTLAPAQQERPAFLCALAQVERSVGAATTQPGAPQAPSALLIGLTRNLTDERSLPLSGAPWMAPLETVAWSDLSADVPSDRESIPIAQLDDPDQRSRPTLIWPSASGGLLVLGADLAEVEQTVGAVIVASIEVGGAQGGTPDVLLLDGGTGFLVRLRELAAVADVIPTGDAARTVKAVADLARTESAPPPDRARPTLLVIHGWGAVADALLDAGGQAAVDQLTRLVRRGGGGLLRVVVTGSSDREVPSRITALLSTRLLHRLADQAGLLSFGTRLKDLPALNGAQVVDPTSGLVGVALRVDAAHIDSLRARLEAAPVPIGGWPQPIRVLTDRISRFDLPSATCSVTKQAGALWTVPIGLDTELRQAAVVVGPGRVVLVLGQPGSGRTTAIETIRAGLSDDVEISVIDDAELKERAEVSELLAAGRGLIVGCTAAAARTFGSWINPLLATAQVVLLNPTRADGELCRVIVPDLTHAPLGRAALIDRGRVTVLQVAA